MSHQLTADFAKRYAFNQPEILAVDSYMACKLPYQGIKLVKQLGSGHYSSVYSALLMRFDPIKGWDVDTESPDGFKLAVKLASTIETPQATYQDYKEAEELLELDSKGLLYARLGSDIEPVTRTHAAEFYASPTPDEDELDFLMKLYFHHAIHPLSSIYTKNGVDGEKRLHSVVGFELLEGGSLCDRLNEGNRCFSEREAWAIMRDVLLGIKQCQNNGVAHRDIKVDNICFGPNDKVTLIDFGMVEIIESEGSRCCRGTPDFLAPELKLYGEYREEGLDNAKLPSMDSKKLDLYAAGECLRWLLDSKYYACSDSVSQASEGELETPGFVMPESLDILDGMQEPDPALRWTVDEALAKFDSWAEAIAYNCNGANPRRAEVSYLRDSRPPTSPPALESTTLIDMNPPFPAKCHIHITWPDISALIEVASLQAFFRSLASKEERAYEAKLMAAEREYALLVSVHDMRERLDALEKLVGVMALGHTEKKPRVDAAKRHIKFALAIPRVKVCC